LLFFTVFALLTLSGCGTKEAAVSEPVPQVRVQQPERPPPPSLIEMVYIAGSTFSMGSARGTPFSHNIERPVHQVTIRNFYLGKYEVTQGEYFEVTGIRPSNFVTNADDEGPDGWKKLPVEMVSWYEAIVFCNKLSIKENLNPVYHINGNTNPELWGSPPSVRD